MDLEYKVILSDLPITLGELIKKKFDLSTRLFNKLIKNEKILVNNKPCDTRVSLNDGDFICLNLDFEEDSDTIVPNSDIKLDIIYEDDWILVVNKPTKMAVHPSSSHFDSSLSNGVKFYFDLNNIKKKIRPVNRLDLDTSGLVVFAKSEFIQESFSKQMQAGIFKKEYIAIVEGFLSNLNGIINLPIARKPGSIIERCIDEINGQTAITEYAVLSELKSYNLSVLKCILKTGRTHQIRVHMAATGHPLIGDTLYGNTSKFISRQALHSHKISAIHPVTKKALNFEAPLPNDMNYNLF